MIKRSFFTVLFLILGAVFSTFAGAQSATPETGSVRGTVIDARTSQPINGANVAVQSLQPSSGWSSATTGADGSFSIRGLAAGRYRLHASHNGYVDSTAGRGEGRGSGVMVSIAAGQDADTVVLRLTPSGVISGRITNERDEPMPGVQVQTMKSSYRDGHRQFSDARAGSTDDRGEFRIWGLAPGRYYIKVTSPRAWDRGPGPMLVYVPAFYPGVVDPSLAQPVELHPGEELNGMNLAVSPLRAVHVKGRVLTSTGAPAKSAQLTLSQSTGSGYSVEAEADATGKFDLPAVPAGSYALVAELSDGSDAAHSLIGRSTVVVGDTNFDSPDVVVFPGATISGHVRFDGDRKVDAPRMSASLHPVANSDPYAGEESAAVQPDGTFIFRNVPEGSYRVRLSSLPDGYYLKAAGDSPDATVLVSHGHASPVELRVGPGAARIQGTVYRDKDNQEAAGAATVILVPDAARRSNSEYYRFTVADQSGKFQLRGIPPGDYSLFACENVERNAYMDPDFLQQYEDAGKAVRVQEGDSLSLQVQLAPVADGSSR